MGEAISVTYQHTNDLFGGFAWLWLSEIVVVLGLSCEHPTLHCALCLTLSLQIWHTTKRAAGTIPG